MNSAIRNSGALLYHDERHALNGRSAGAPSISLWFAEVEDLLRQHNFDHLLSVNERRRIGRSHADRRRSRMASYVLRRIALSQMIGCTVDRCVFGEDHRGRPVIESPIEARDLSLSLSRTGSNVAVALGRGTTVGIDIEVTCYSREQLEFVAQTYNRAELCLVDRYFERSEGILAVWTIKEAIGKAQGIGVGTLHHEHGISPVPFGTPQALWLNDSGTKSQMALLSVSKPRPNLWMSIVTTGTSTGKAETRRAPYQPSPALVFSHENL